MNAIESHTNDNGITYYSTTDGNGETIYSFTQDFEDIWSQEDEDLENKKMTNIQELAQTIRGDIRLNAGRHLNAGRQISIAHQEHVALDGMRTARRYLITGNGTVTVELTEYNGASENNIPGGPINANVFARLIMSRDISEVATWIATEEIKWIETHNAQ